MRRTLWIGAAAVALVGLAVVLVTLLNHRTRAPIPSRYGSPIASSPTYVFVASVAMAGTEEDVDHGFRTLHIVLKGLEANGIATRAGGSRVWGIEVPSSDRERALVVLGSYRTAMGLKNLTLE